MGSSDFFEYESATSIDKLKKGEPNTFLKVFFFCMIGTWLFVRF